MSAFPLSSRPLSPIFSLPQSHSELLSVYKSFSVFSPRVKSRTYQKDAAGLIVSWFKRKIKERILRWRINSNEIVPNPVSFSNHIKKPAETVKRRVFYQVQINRKIRNDRNNSPGLPSPEPVYKSAKILKKKLDGKQGKKGAVSQGISWKLDSVRKIAAFISHLKEKVYLDVFFLLLVVMRRYWIGRKVVRVLMRRVKNRTQALFSELKKNEKVNFELFKYFKKSERNFERLAPVELLPREGKTLFINKEIQTVTPMSNSLLDISTQSNQLKNYHFEFSPISKGKKMSPYSNENLNRFSMSVYSPLRKQKKLSFLLLARFSWLKKSLKIFQECLSALKTNKKNYAFSSLKLNFGYFHLSRTLTKILFLRLSAAVNSFIFYSRALVVLQKALRIPLTFYRLLKQKSFYRLRPVYHRQPNRLGFLAYVLKTHFMNQLRTSFIFLNYYTTALFIKRKEKISFSLTAFSQILESQVYKTRLFFIRVLKKHLFYLKGIQSAKDFRSSKRKTSTFVTWKNLKMNNKNKCRGFELLGAFFNRKKIDIFGCLRLSYPIQHYKSVKFSNLLRLIKVVYRYQKNKVSVYFKQWKLIQMYIKMLQFSVIINKFYIVNLLEVWSKVKLS